MRGADEWPRRASTPVGSADYLNRIRAGLPPQDGAAFDEEVGRAMARHGVDRDTMHEHPIVAVIAEMVVYRVTFEKMIARAAAHQEQTELLHGHVRDAVKSFDKANTDAVRDLARAGSAIKAELGEMFRKERHDVIEMRRIMEVIEGRTWPWETRATFFVGFIVSAMIGVIVDRYILQ